MKIAKERIIYNNYDLSDMYDDAKEILIANGNEEPSDDEIWNELYFQDECYWQDEQINLDSFFNGKTVGFFGATGRWNKVHRGGCIGEFWKVYHKAIEDCNYVKIYDENGHLYLTCSHHDGTNHYEIKLISDKGYEYLQNWEYGSDNRSKEQVYTQIFNRYSTLPRFAEKVYGCKPREFEESTKGKLIDKLNNEARSFYS